MQTTIGYATRNPPLTCASLHLSCIYVQKIRLSSRDEERNLLCNVSLSQLSEIQTKKKIMETRFQLFNMTDFDISSVFLKRGKKNFSNFRIGGGRIKQENNIYFVLQQSSYIKCQIFYPLSTRNVSVDASGNVKGINSLEKSQVYILHLSCILQRNHLCNIFSLTILILFKNINMQGRCFLLCVYKIG